MSVALSSPVAVKAGGPAATPPVAAVCPRPVLPVLAMIAGLATMALAGTTLVARAGGGRPPAPSVAAATSGAVLPGDPLAITLSARDVSVVSQVYDPGQTSGWHLHAGIHAVAVISGTLTVYESDCHAQLVDPTHPWVGGQTPHLVRNETSEPVVMSVTYLTSSTPTNSTRRVDAPAGCELAS